jgi:hypothetical protein
VDWGSGFYLDGQDLEEEDIIRRICKKKRQRSRLDGSLNSGQNISGRMIDGEEEGKKKW